MLRLPHSRAVPGQDSGGKARHAVVLALTAALSAGTGVSAGFLTHHPAAGSTPAAAPAVITSASPRTTPKPGNPGTAELPAVQRIAAVLRQSAAARAWVVKAVNGAGGCAMAAPEAVSLIKAALKRRQAAITEAAGLSATAIPKGESLMASMLTALRDSNTADHDFLRWIQRAAAAQACPASTDSDYQAGYQASVQATRAKKRFARQWNPLARTFGEPTISANSI